MKLKEKIVGGILCCTMLFGCILPAAATDIKDAQNKEQQLEQQKEQAQQEQKTYQQKIEQISTEMRQASEKIDSKLEQIEAAEQEVIMAKVEENAQYESMKLRIKYMYENSTNDMLTMFLEAKSLADFCNIAEYASMVSKYDRDKLNEFQLTVQKVEAREQILQREYLELTSLRDTLTEKSKEAEMLLSAKSAELANIETELNQVKEQIKNAQAETNKNQEAADANKPENKPSSQPSNKPSNSGSKPESKPPVVSGNAYFTHPCPGMTKQTSYFGEVRQGIGDTRPHKGHDYAAPEGTPIYAAASGKVLIAGYSSSAGYWVVIDHGKGLVSKYMHMYKKPAVTAGSRVSKGQYIGGVGTTGQSTGNHLHFQVELNGVAVNPSKYM